MFVTEIVQRPGSFTFDLLESTPRSVVDEVVDALETREGYVVVFPSRVETPADDDGLYAGVLTARDGLRRFGGYALSGLLGTDRGVGVRAASATTFSSLTMDQLLDALLPANGITKGTVGTGLSTVSGTWTPDVSLREFLDEMVAASGGEWRINTDGSFDVAPPDQLYPATPTVFVSDQFTSNRASPGLRGVVGTVDAPQLNMASYTSRVDGFGQGDGVSILTASAVGVQGGRGYDGSTLNARRTLDLPSSDQTELDSLTAAALARFNQAQYRGGLTLSAKWLRRDLAPGDPVYAWLPQFRLDTSNPLVMYRGQATKPFLWRVVSMLWASHDGLGIWLRRATAGGTVWNDLTKYVVLGNGETTLGVSSDDGPQGELLDVGVDRHSGRNTQRRTEEVA